MSGSYRQGDKAKAGDNGSDLGVDTPRLDGPAAVHGTAARAFAQVPMNSDVQTFTLRDFDSDSGAVFAGSITDDTVAVPSGLGTELGIEYGGGSLEPPSAEDAEAISLAARSRAAGKASGAQRAGLNRMEPIPLASPTLLLQGNSTAMPGGFRAMRRPASKQEATGRELSRGTMMPARARGASVHVAGSRAPPEGTGISAAERSHDIRRMLRDGRRALAGHGHESRHSRRRSRASVATAESATRRSTRSSARSASSSKGSVASGTASASLSTLLRGLVSPSVTQELSDGKAARGLHAWLDKQLEVAREALAEPGNRAGRAAAAALEASRVSGLGLSSLIRNQNVRRASTASRAGARGSYGALHGGTGSTFRAGGFNTRGAPARVPGHELSLRSSEQDPVVVAIRGYWHARLDDVAGPGGALLLDQDGGFGVGIVADQAEGTHHRAVVGASGTSLSREGEVGGTTLSNRMEAILRADAEAGIIDDSDDRDGGAGGAGLSRAILDSAELSRRAFQTRRLLSVSVDVLCSYEAAATEVFRRLGQRCIEAGRTLVWMWDATQSLWERRIAVHINRMESTREQTDAARFAAAELAGMAADQQEENAVARTAMV